MTTIQEKAALGAAQVRYSAAWQQSTAGEIQVYGFTYEDYRKKYDELWGQGWRLKALQPFVLPGDQVRYSAVWTQSTAGEIQVYGWTYEDFRKKYDELWGQGWRLKIIQPFVLSGDRVRYTAVWRQSTAGELQVYGWTYEDFRKKYDELWPKGWRVAALQPFVLAGDQVRYTAVWTQSTAGEIQVYGWTYDDYRKKYDELWKQGWRLKLLQPFTLSGGVRYTAVWQPGTAGEIQVYGWSYEDYRKKYDELWPKGWRLKLLQPYTSTAPAPPVSPQLTSQALTAYQKTGGITGPLGAPLSAVTVAGNTARWNLTGGRIVSTINGNNDITIDEYVEIYFVGFKCWGESDELSSSDEPYFLVSHASPGHATTANYKFDNVDKNDEVISPKLLATGLPVMTGILHVAVMENDEGSPSEARKKVQQAMEDVAKAGQQAAAIYDMSAAAAGNDGALTPWADLAGLVVGGPIGTLVARGLVGGLGLADDFVGERGATLFDKKIGYATPPTIGTAGGEGYTHKFWIDGKSQGKYDVYLRVQKVKQPRPWVD
jgi:hypothetical protein